MIILYQNNLEYISNCEHIEKMKPYLVAYWHDVGHNIRIIKNRLDTSVENTDVDYANYLKLVDNFLQFDILQQCQPTTIKDPPMIYLFGSEYEYTVAIKNNPRIVQDSYLVGCIISWKSTSTLIRLIKSRWSVEHRNGAVISFKEFNKLINETVQHLVNNENKKLQPANLETSQITNKYFIQLKAMEVWENTLQTMLAKNCQLVRCIECANAVSKGFIEEFGK